MEAEVSEIDEVVRWAYALDPEVEFTDLPEDFLDCEHGVNTEEEKAEKHGVPLD